MTLLPKDFKAGDVVKLSEYGAIQFPDFIRDKYQTEPWVVQKVQGGYIGVKIPNYDSRYYLFISSELEIVKQNPRKPIRWI